MKKIKLPTNKQNRANIITEQEKLSSASEVDNVQKKNYTRE